MEHTTSAQPSTLTADRRAPQLKAEDQVSNAVATLHQHVATVVAGGARR
jgi:hypothetical protein